MADRVPYTGVPTQNFRFDPTPEFHIDTPPAAFGVNVAQAVQNLGQVQEGAGKELFDRAYAMQTLHEQAHANANLADAQNQMLQETIKHNELQGKASVDDYPGFQQRLGNIRNAGAQGLSPIGTQFYDQESRSSLFRLNFSAGARSAEENRKYIVGSNNAAMSSLESEGALDPDNEQANAQRIAAIKQRAIDNNHMAGLSEGDPQWDLNIKTATSSYISSQIRGLADKSPFKAQKLLDEAMRDKTLEAGPTNIYGRNNIQMLQEYVTGKLNTIGSRVAATEATSGTRFGDRVVSDQQLLSGLKASEGGTYSFQGPDVTDKAGNTGHALGHYGVMSYNLQGWLRESGMGPMTEAEFKANPTAQDQLALFKMKQYQDKFGSANAAAIAWFGGEGSVNANIDNLRDKNMNGREYLGNFNRGLNPTLRQVRDAAAQTANDHLPGNAQFAEATDQRAIMNWENNQREQRDEEFNNRQTLDGVIAKGYESGKPPSSVEELTASPEAKAAWDAMLPSDQLVMMGALAKDAKGDIPRTQERELKWGMLQGLLPERPDEFLKETENPVSLDLPWDMRQKIISQRQQVYGRTFKAPEVSHALGVLGDQMRAAGLAADQDDKDNRALFTGILHDVMQDFQANNNRPMKDEEIRTAGVQILRRIGAGWMSSGTPWFENVGPAPDEAAKIIAADPSWGGVVPSAEQIQRIWVGKQYQEQFGKAPKVPSK